ncbi:hypothetical protein O1Q96_18735 [Streptomyces sp. Qhu-G9]|uniref:hypothetical protein n=1 Tax=Streptomyces sp. Qhu-G9 TaxID=3452799 RepID=UPI0022AC762E|nr:hypothetical protein [Streptomyces aurantiacus]WAU81639.1 hypothetical protein O1Q96_18735 [Streptomyces aurantiacus]
MRAGGSLKVITREGAEYSDFPRRRDLGHRAPCRFSVRPPSTSPPWGDLAASEGPTHVHAEVGGHLLAEERPADALLCFDRAAAAGGTDVLASVGAELTKAEDLDQTLTWYERAAAAGHTNALAEAAGSGLRMSVAVLR